MPDEAKVQSPHQKLYNGIATAYNMDTNKRQSRLRVTKKLGHADSDEPNTDEKAKDQRRYGYRRRYGHYQEAIKAQGDQETRPDTDESNTHEEAKDQRRYEYKRRYRY